MTNKELIERLKPYTTKLTGDKKEEILKIREVLSEYKKGETK